MISLKVGYLNWIMSIKCKGWLNEVLVGRSLVKCMMKILLSEG